MTAETVTVLNVIDIASLVSEIYLAMERHIHTQTHTHRHRHTHRHGLGSTVKFATSLTQTKRIAFSTILPWPTQSANPRHLDKRNTGPSQFKPWTAAPL